MMAEEKNQEQTQPTQQQRILDLGAATTKSSRGTVYTLTL